MTRVCAPFLYFDQRCYMGGGSAKKGPQTPRGAFLEHPNRLGGIFEAPKAPRKFEKCYFFIEKSIFRRNIKDFWNFFFKNFWHFLKIVAWKWKKSIFRKKWWVTKTTWGHFSITKTTWREKSEKDPPTTSLISILDEKHHIYGVLLVSKVFKMLLT